MTGYKRCRAQRTGDLGGEDLALEEYATSPLYDDRERVALEYADAIILSERDVDDGLFERVRAVFDEDAVVELTVVISWEKFFEQVQPAPACTFTGTLEAR